MDAFIQKTLEMAKRSGIEEAEIYYTQRDSFRAMTQRGEISQYTVNTGKGLSLRGIYKGKMGYASTEAFDADAAKMLTDAVRESAELNEDPDTVEIYGGDGDYPAVGTYEPALEKVGEKEKLDYLLSAEKLGLARDTAIAAASYNMLSTVSHEVRIVNTHGLSLSARDNIAFSYLSLLAKRADRTAGGDSLHISRDFSTFDPEAAAKEAAEKALFMLDAAPLASGRYRTIFNQDAMSDLIQAFSGIFSAENAQQNMSLLAGKEGSVIAAPCVTLIDDPLLPGGWATRGFDDEGVRARTKNVIEQGTLTTLLHNLKTAARAGVKSTGNASKAGYSAPVRVSPANFYLKPGAKDLDGLMAEMDSGLVITSLAGLHAGANPLSGDFSLMAEGYTVNHGKKDRPVERITVAGNFYELLKSIRALGSDLKFSDSAIGSPSADVGEMTIAG